MPYIIVNDRSKPWHYYTALTTTFGWVATIHEDVATRLDLLEATAVMKGKPDLYAAGWKITPSPKTT